MSKIVKSRGKELEEWQKWVLEEWSSNGFNMSKAIRTVKPEVTNPSAAVHMFKSFSNTKEGKSYIDSIQKRLRSQLHISKEQVLQEFINHAYSDAHDFTNLTEEKFKELPPNVRRQIQSFKETERTEIDRKGNAVTVKTIDCKLVDKQGALKEVAKIIGAYEIDNKQKRGSSLLDNATFEQKKKYINLLNEIQRENEKKSNVIDVTPEED